MTHHLIHLAERLTVAVIIRSFYRSPDVHQFFYKFQVAFIPGCTVHLCNAHVMRRTDSITCLFRRGLVVKTYQEKVKKGDLRSSATSANGHNGTRLDGTFSKDIRGAAVIYQIRDKTVTLRTDADTFKPDFEALIKTLDFNQ